MYFFLLFHMLLCPIIEKVCIKLQTLVTSPVYHLFSFISKRLKRLN